jgi:hypothetical protein
MQTISAASMPSRSMTRNGTSMKSSIGIEEAINPDCQGKVPENIIQ